MLLMVLSASASLNVLGQQPCSYMHHVTDPDYLVGAQSYIMGCGNRTSYPEVFGEWPNAWENQSCSPSGKTWRFHMKHGSSANCQDALYSPSHKGTLEFVGPYMQTMICAASCALKANIDYDYGATWTDNSNSVSVSTNGYSAFSGGHVIEIFNIQTPAGSNRRMLLAYEKKNGKPRLEGFYGWWDVWSHFVVEGKVVVFQEGCTNSDAYNYNSEALHQDITSCDMTSQACDDNEACNYNNADGWPGAECDYTSCDCEEPNACNYNQVYDGSGNTEASNWTNQLSCEYSSCTCDDDVACNYDNNLGQAGANCDYTTCDCDEEGADNYASGNGVEDCEWTCQDDTACNYGETVDHANPCIYPVGGCGDECILNAPGFSITASQYAGNPSAIGISLDHVIQDNPYDYSAFEFEARIPGGEWEPIEWDQPVADIYTVGTALHAGGKVDFSGRLTRCSVELEIRETLSPNCLSINTINLSPFTLSESGCSDPEACNFTSLCADDSVPCEYADVIWLAANDTEYDEYVEHVCPEPGQSAVSSSCIQLSEPIQSFEIHAVMDVGDEEDALVVNGPLCEFQSSELIDVQRLDGAVLPNVVPNQGALLTWLSVGHGRQEIEDLWSGRPLMLESAEYSVDRFGNASSALALNGSYRGVAALTTQQWTCGDPYEYQGYSYETVLIGDQCWFAENLRARTFANGDAIQANWSDADWAYPYDANGNAIGGTRVYGESDNCSSYLDGFDVCESPELSVDAYGRLYNWHAVNDSRNLCPSGWYVPSSDDWIALVDLFGGIDSAGPSLRSSSGWYGNTGTNASGFSALPGGSVTPESVFNHSGTQGAWWTSTWNSQVPSGVGCNSCPEFRSTTWHGDIFGKWWCQPEFGYSVRCVDSAPSVLNDCCPNRNIQKYHFAYYDRDKENDTSFEPSSWTMGLWVKLDLSNLAVGDGINLYDEQFVDLVPSCSCLTDKNYNGIFDEEELGQSLALVRTGQESVSLRSYVKTDLGLGGEGYATSSIPFSDVHSTWVHLTFVQPDEGEGTFFLNGEPLSYNQTAIPWSDFGEGQARALLGDVDEIGFWADALSTSQVLALMDVSKTTISFDVPYGQRTAISLSRVDEDSDAEASLFLSGPDALEAVNMVGEEAGGSNTPMKMTEVGSVELADTISIHTAPLIRAQGIFAKELQLEDASGAPSSWRLLEIWNHAEDSYSIGMPITLNPGPFTSAFLDSLNLHWNDDSLISMGGEMSYSSADTSHLHETRHVPFGKHLYTVKTDYAGNSYAQADAAIKLIYTPDAFQNGSLVGLEQSESAESSFIAFDVSSFIDVDSLTAEAVTSQFGLTDVATQEISFANSSLQNNGDTIEHVFEDVDFLPSHFLRSFSPIDVLGAASETVEGYVRPQDLGFQNSNCPGVLFGNGDGLTHLQLLSGADIASSKVRLSLPLMPSNVGSEVITGEDALENSLPFWGIPNGVEAYAEMHVVVQSPSSSSERTFSFSSDEVYDTPLLRNAPYLLGDSLICEIAMNSLPSGFVVPGQALKFEMIGIWATPGRKTVLTDHGVSISGQSYASNEIIFCGDPGSVVLESAFQTVDDNDNVQIGLIWNKPEGGRVTLQRQIPGESWQDVITFDDLEVNQYVDTLTSNEDIDACDEVKYRLRIFMCDALGETYSTTVVETIQGDLIDPWIDVLGQHVFVSKGTSPQQVGVNWSSYNAAPDIAKEHIDVFEIQRRIYAPDVTISSSDWEVVATLPSTQLNYTDENALPGYLYQYRVSANALCSGAGAVAVKFESNSDLGFRHGVAEVSGDVTFQFGTAVDSVVVTGVNTSELTDYHLDIQQDEFLELELSGLEEELAAGFAQSFWWKMPSVGTNANVNASNSDLSQTVTWPVASWWYELSGDDSESELLSLYVTELQDGTFDLNIFKSGSVLHEMNVSGLSPGQWNHFTIEIDLNQNALTCFTWDGSGQEGMTSMELPESLDMLTRLPKLKRVVFGAGPGVKRGCTNENAANFDAFANSSSSCEFAQISENQPSVCTDPEASVFSIDNPADSTFYLQLNANECVFAGDNVDIVRINWYVDHNAAHHPVIKKSDESGELVTLWQGTQDKIVTGSFSANEPVSYRVALTPGSYHIVPFASGMAADEYYGTYSVISESYGELLPYVNYTSTDLGNPDSNSSFFVPEVCGNALSDEPFVADLYDPTPTFLDVGCQECHSWSFIENDAMTLSRTITVDVDSDSSFQFTTIQDTLHSWQEFAVEFWVQVNRDIPELGGIDICTLGENNTLKLGVQDGNFVVKNAGSGTLVAKHRSLHEEEAGVSEIQPWLWYHVVLNMDGQNMSLNVKPVYFDDLDGDPWNDGLHDTILVEDALTDWVPSGASTLLTLGSEQFKGYIHRFSFFSKSLTDEQIEMLFHAGSESAWVMDDSEFLEATQFVGVAGLDLNYNRMLPLGQGSRPVDVLTISGGPVETVFRAPADHCQQGCTRLYESGGAVSYTPSDFNPFLSTFSQCNLQGLNVSGSSVSVATNELSLDHVQLWSSALNANASFSHLDYRDRHVPSLSQGLLNYLDFDERVGIHAYDRSRTTAGDWRTNHATLRKIESNPDGAWQSASPLADSDKPHFSTTGGVTHLKHYAYTDGTTGQYVIPTLKLRGSGSQFKIEPSKTAHVFQPNQLYPNIPDGNRIKENQDFFDLSSFSQDIRVVYTPIAPGPFVVDENGVGLGSVYDHSSAFQQDADGVSDQACPVAGATILIDGLPIFPVATEDDPQPEAIKTDKNGEAKIRVPIGEHTISVAKDEHTFDVSAIQVIMVADATDTLTFVDNTSRRAVGTLLGGAESAKPYGTASNNVGFAKFTLFPVTANEDFAQEPTSFLTRNGVTLYPMKTCPAIPVQTDEHGAYSTQLLPMQYVIEEVNNSDVEGYTLLESVKTYMEDGDELTDARKIELLNESEHRPTGDWFEEEVDAFILNLDGPLSASYLTPDADEIPEGADDFESIVYRAGETLLSWDAGQSTSSGDSLTPQCPTVSQVPTSLDEVFEKQFIGDWNFVKTVGARKYRFDARAHFDEWAEGLQEKPFPAGKPVIEVSLTPRCMAHAVMAVYGCDYEGYSFNELALAAPSESNPLEIVVIEAMHKDQVGTSGTHAFPWQGTPITRFVVGSPNHTNNSEPFVGTLKVELHNANNEDVGGWKPYRADVSDAHSNDDLSETHLEFYILGEEYDELEGSTLPTTSRLDMILRDPPGDGSSSTLLAGSTKMTSREQTSTWGGAAIAGGGVSLGMKTEIGVSIGAFLGLGGGTTTGVETTVETEITNETESEVVAGSASGVSNGLTESLTITQSISTSAAEQDQSGGDHQDLYFGVSENISRKEVKNFGWELPSPHDDTKTFGGHNLLGNAVPFVCVDCDQTIEAPDGALLPADASAPDTLNFNVAWSINQRTAIEPASYFLKTEHTIESIDIPQLEALRDAELQAGRNSDPPLYALEDWQHKDSVPDGMYLANSDDPRWILFHQGHWLGKTINGQLWNSTDKFTLPLRPLVYSAGEKSGPGYTFLGDNLEDDKVRYYNDLIMQWKLFIAQNELEKLNARELLYDNLANYSDLNDITNPFSPVYGPNLDNGTIPLDASLADIAEWGNLDFAPFFITFSGGGSEYTQSYSKSTVQSQSSNRETSIETNTTNTTGILVNGNGGSITAGASTSSSSGYDFGSESETMLDYSYTLTDDDEDDWQFVAVMPGRGANSAIFLTLNSNGSSCPWLDKETPRYAELFPLLYSPQNLERAVEQTILQETTILCPEKSWQALSVPQDAMAPGNGAITSYFATLHELDNYRSNLVSNLIFTDEQANAFNAVEVTPENEEPKAWSMMESLCTKVENDAPLVIQPAQYQLQQVHLDVVGSEVSFGANINDPIVFNLRIENKSEFGNAADYILNVIPDQNTLGANVSFAGGASSVELSSLVKGSPVEVPVVVEANGLTDFESLVGQIGFYVESLCDSQIYEEIFLNFAFAPDCSPIELDTPVDGWLANTTQVVSASNYADADLMTVQVSGINMKLNNFEGGNQNVFDIQVRRTGATEPSNVGWKTVRTVTKTDTYTNDSGILTVNGNDEGSYFGVISRQELFFDPFGSTAPFEDDAVEIRAVSTCVNDLRRESNVAAGSVDLVRPATFGKPIPQDGIYDLDEQFVVRFNEAMNPSSVQSDAFSVRGFFNGHNNWEGALGFDMFQNVEVLDAPNLLSRSWRASVQVHPKESQEGVHIPLNGVLFSQVIGGDGIEIGFNQNGLRIEIFNSASGTNDVYDFQGFESTDWSLPTWKTLEMEFVFEGYNDNSQLEGYFNVSVNNATSYATPRMPLPQTVSEVLLVGNDASGSSNLTAAIKDIRFWHIPSESDISAWTSENISNAPLTHPVNGTESGLVMWLTPARQSEGIEVGDWARHRVVSSSAQLILPEGGYSLVSNPTDAWEAVYQNDVTGPESVEFWWKLSALEASVVMSSDTWEISLDDAGLLTLEMQEDFTESSATSATAIDVGTWHHIAVVGEEHNIVKMYVDGMEVLSHQFEQAFRVPGLSFGGTGSMNGHVDEVRVWSKSLTQEDIESNMYVRVETSTHSNLAFVEHFEESSLSDGTAVPTGVLSDGTVDPSWDASTYAYIGLNNVSETAVEVVQNVEYNALNDEFLLTFAESELYKFENQVVTVEMDKTPSDELGNELASTLSWSYFFDRSPLKLSVDEWSTSFTLGESATMTAQLFNESIEVTSFEIVDVPTWLDVHPMQGAIGPLGTVDIEIATTLDVDLGMHVADIRCIDPNFCQPPSGGAPAWCFGENLLVKLDVVAEEMEFEFDDSPFSENMAIVARVMNGGFFSHDPEDVVLAYINGELRGVAKLDVGIDDQQFAFLTVHFDAPMDSTTPIDFRVWDASRGITFTSVETSHQGSDTMVFANSTGEQNYSVFEPLVLRTSNHVVQTIEFEDGWNWISFNVEDDRLQNGPSTVFSELNGKIEEVRNQTGVAQWNGDSLYNFGLETRLNDMYQVKLNESASLELSGLIPDRFEDAQSLAFGWQHLGYNAQRKLPINEALQHLADHAIVLDGDIIKSRSHGFAVYVGDEWVGSLTHMEPDQGYKLFLGQEVDGSLGELVFPADAMIPGFDIRHEPATPDVWEQDVSELMATSTAIVRIETTRPVHRSPHDVLGAFAEIDGEWTCVGQAFALSQDGDALYFLTTYTEGAMTDLTFKWYSDEEGQSFESDDHALIIADEMKGTLTDPYVLRFETPHVDLDQSSEAGRGGVADGSGPCNAKGKLQVSPSLVDNELEANVFVECAILSIDVVDVTGNKVTSLPLSDMGEVSCQGTPGQTVTCDVQHLASGMYRLVVRTEEGILVTPFVKAQ